MTVPRIALGDDGYTVSRLGGRITTRSSFSKSWSRDRNSARLDGRDIWFATSVMTHAVLTMWPSKRDANSHAAGWYSSRGFNSAT